MAEHDPIADLLLERWGRCTLPIQQVGKRAAGTAFLYNELVASTPEGDQVREWLLTADELTRCDAAEIRLRPELIEPAGAAADFLTVLEFEKLWSHGPAVAATRTAFLHEHADRKGWRWRTDEITEGTAARAGSSRTVPTGPHRAYALGHVTTEPGESAEPRPLALATSNITNDPDRVVRWRGSLPDGFTGAPVFITEHRGGREFALYCVGLIAGGDRNPPVVTFDVVRAMIERLTGGTTRPAPRIGFRSLFRRRER